MKSPDINPMPGDRKGDPSDTQITAMDVLVEHHLEGVECEPTWILLFDNDDVALSVSRGSKCVYRDGMIQKQDAESFRTSSAEDFMEQVTDATVIQASFKNWPATQMGSRLEARVSDSGNVWAQPGTRHGLADMLGALGAKKTVEAIGDDLDKLKVVRIALNKFADLANSVNWTDPSEEQAEALETSSYDLLEAVSVDIVSGVIDDDFGDPDQIPPEGEEIAQKLIKACSAQGEVSLNIDTTFSVEGYHAEVGKDPFNTGYYGTEVIGYASIRPSDTSGNDKGGMIEFMNDGSYRYLPDDSRERRPATEADFAKFIAVLSLPKIK